MSPVADAASSLHPALWIHDTGRATSRPGQVTERCVATQASRHCVPVQVDRGRFLKGIHGCCVPEQAFGNCILARVNEHCVHAQVNGRLRFVFRATPLATHDANTVANNDSERTTWFGNVTRDASRVSQALGSEGVS